MKAELLKLKASGLSQHMFALTTPQQSAPSTNRQPCHQFARGRCRFANCRFSHTPVPVGSSMPSTGGQRQRGNNRDRCAFCYNNGHLAPECRKRLAQLATVPAGQQAAMIVHTPSDESTPSNATTESKAPDIFTFVFLTTDKALNSWVLADGENAIDGEGDEGKAAAKDEDDGEQEGVEGVIVL